MHLIPPKNAPYRAKFTLKFHINATYICMYVNVEPNNFLDVEIKYCMLKTI